MTVLAASLTPGLAWADAGDAHKSVLRAANGGEPVLKQLIAGGIPVDTTDDDGETALMEAADKGNLAAVQILLRNGAQVNLKDHDGKTALMYAADEGRTAVVQLLLASGADASLKDNDGDTALDMAKEEGYADTAAALRAAAQSPTPAPQPAAPPALTGKAGLKAVFRAACNGDAALKQLLAGGTAVDCTDADGETALVEAADKGNLAAVQVWMLLVMVSPPWCRLF